MKKNILLTLVTITALFYGPSAIAQSANTHNNDMPTSYHTNDWEPIRHFEAGQFGVGTGQKIFIGGREPIGNISWNAYPGEDASRTNKFLINGVHAAQMAYSSWAQIWHFNISDPTVTPVQGANVTWKPAFWIDASGNFITCNEIQGNKVRVALHSFCDYVFEPTYKRMSLFELEKYVTEHKHLPGIPSEKELLDSGVLDLGDMQVRQMEKIEELTLYVIDLNKEIDTLKKEVEVLKAPTTTTNTEKVCNFDNEAAIQLAQQKAEIELLKKELEELRKLIIQPAAVPTPKN